MERPFLENISKEDVILLPNGQFEGTIVVVDSDEGLLQACEYLLHQPVIGFDTETRPTFKAGDMNNVALVQLSTAEKCFLFRLCSIQFDKAVIKILESRDVLKIGADIKGDIKALQKLRHFKANGFIDLQTIICQWGVAEKSVRKMAAIVLGLRISKAQRLSNWEAVTLTPAQQVYAATDAWACLEIYNQLESKPKPEPKDDKEDNT